GVRRARRWRGRQERAAGRAARSLRGAAGRLQGAALRGVPPRIPANADLAGPATQAHRVAQRRRRERLRSHDGTVAHRPRGERVMGRYGYYVVDGDGHVLETEATWDRFLEPKFRAAAPRMISDNRGVKRFLIDGWFWTTPPGPGVGHPGGYEGGAKIEKYHGGSDPKARLGDMDLQGIDGARLFATGTMAPSCGKFPSAGDDVEEAPCLSY